ncbi:MAG: bifunctional DNA-formamidopyrimidine glycosylase/DNA-(apurinic or apyrimidinic site) lyase [Sphaerochaetaceae bacterium]
MPELPEVETTCHDLVHGGLLHQKITKIIVGWEPMLLSLSAVEFNDSLVGRSFISLHRRGKYIVFTTDDEQTLLIHLRMSGSLSLQQLQYTKEKHDHVLFFLEKSILVFRDMRKFGRCELTDNPASVLSTLGIEPLSTELNGSTLYALFHHRKSPLKALLLNQSLIAGLGNIYADEALFASRLHPKRSGSSLTLIESERLANSIKEVLTEALAHRGTSLGDGQGNFISQGKRGEHAVALKVFRKTAAPCPLCATPIQRIKIAQRSTHFCPACQPIDP